MNGSWHMPYAAWPTYTILNNFLKLEGNAAVVETNSAARSGGRRPKVIVERLFAFSVDQWHESVY